MFVTERSAAMPFEYLVYFWVAVEVFVFGMSASGFEHYISAAVSQQITNIAVDADLGGLLCWLVMAMLGRKS